MSGRPMGHSRALLPWGVGGRSGPCVKGQELRGRGTGRRSSAVRAEAHEPEEAGREPARRRLAPEAH